MPIKATGTSTYKVQSESDKRRWYDVIIKTKRSSDYPDYECSCSNWRCTGSKCQHIERALTAYIYGV